MTGPTDLPPFGGETPRICSGMFLAYKPDGRNKYEQLLYVRSIRRAKKWTSATLVGNDGVRPDDPAQSWANYEYSVKFPGHVVREPFRVVSGRDLLWTGPPHVSDVQTIAGELRRHYPEAVPNIELARDVVRVVLAGARDARLGKAASP